MCRFAIGRAELVGKHFGAHTVDGAREVAVGYGRVASLDRPHRLAQAADGRRRIEDNFSAVDAVHHPVLRMMASVANVDGDPTELSLATGLYVSLTTTYQYGAASLDASVEIIVLRKLRHFILNLYL